MAMGWKLEDIAKAMGPTARVNNGVLELELIEADGTRTYYPFAACLQYIHTEARRAGLYQAEDAVLVDPPVPGPILDPPPPIEDPPPPPPPPQSFELPVAAADLRRTNVQSMGFDVDHVNVWGRPGEGVEFTIHVDTPASIGIVYDYVLAKEASTEPSTRAEAVGVNPANHVVSFPPTSDLWAGAAHGFEPYMGTMLYQIPAGDTTVSLTNDAVVDWSNWLDLYGVKVLSNTPVTLVGTPVVVTLPPVVVPPPVILPPVVTPPPVVVGTPPPPPSATGTVWNVPAQGTLQSVVDQARPGDTVYVTGAVVTGGKSLIMANRDNGSNPIKIIGKPGNVLRSGESGVEAFGSCRGWYFQDLNFEINGGAYYGSGVSFYGQRTDFGGDGAGCSNISLINCTIKPIAGTGSIQRDGVTMWGSDLIEVAYCTITNAAYNDLGFFGGAGSGISVGDTIKSPLGNLPNGTRVHVHHNTISGMRGPGTASADRNGINLDGYQNRGDSLRGTTLIENNTISNCEGRGILAAFAGYADSPIKIYNNVVRAPMATNLGGSLPGGIVAYGGGTHSNIECIDNDVTVSPGFNAYLFEAVSDVKGHGNKGAPAVGAPSGF